MAGAADSDDYAQSNAYLDSGQDLELERVNAFYTHSSTTTVEPTYPSVNDFPDLNYFRDAFGSQYSVPQCNYPLPIAAHDYQRLPYPKLLAQTLEPTNAYYAPRDGRTEDSWAQRCMYTNNPTVAPCQTILLDVGQRDTSYTHARDTSGPEVAVDQRELPDVPHTLQHVTSHQDSTYPRPLGEPRTLFLATKDSFRDGSTPYVPGHTTGREDELQRLTKVWTAVAEQSGFVCDDCGKDCKTKAGLGHHKVTHDKSKAHRHKCDECSAGFRYPKDLRRHHDAKHGGSKYSCTDCHKTYRRKDHLTRHLIGQGHLSSLEGSSVHSTSSATADSQDPSSRKPLGVHQSGHVQLAYHSNEHNHSLNSLDDPGTRSIALDVPETYSYPALLEVPRRSLGSVVNGSLDGSFTVSEVESFSSDTFGFK